MFSAALGASPISVSRASVTRPALPAAGLPADQGFGRSSVSVLAAELPADRGSGRSSAALPAAGLPADQGLGRSSAGCSGRGVRPAQGRVPRARVARRAQRATTAFGGLSRHEVASDAHARARPGGYSAASSVLLTHFPARRIIPSSRVCLWSPRQRLLSPRSSGMLVRSRVRFRYGRQTPSSSGQTAPNRHWSKTTSHDQGRRASTQASFQIREL